jgi:hypothetical protein
MSAVGWELEPERRTHDVSAATTLTRQKLSRDEGEVARGAMRSGKARSGGRRTGREAVRREREAAAWEATAGWLGAQVQPARPWRMGMAAWGCGAVLRTGTALSEWRGRLASVADGSRRRR